MVKVPYHDPLAYQIHTPHPGIYQAALDLLIFPKEKSFFWRGCRLMQREASMPEVTLLSENLVTGSLRQRTTARYRACRADQARPLQVAVPARS